MDIAFNPADYPTYNVGDKVTIRQWDDMESEFGLDEYGGIKVPKTFTKFMKKYCGQTFPIVHVNRYPSPKFDSYFFDGTSVVFSSPMFEQSYPTVVSSTLSFDDLLKGAAAQLAKPQA